MEGAVPPADEFYTEEKCFEIEIVKTLLSKNRQDLIRQIALDLDHEEDSYQSLFSEYLPPSFSITPMRGFDIFSVPPTGKSDNIEPYSFTMSNFFCKRRVQTSLFTIGYQLYNGTIFAFYPMLVGVR